jgi:peptidoglycan/LPS O-acetylase OafA/YrhL
LPATVRVLIILALVSVLVFFTEIFSAFSFAPALYAVFALILSLFVIADQVIHPNSVYNLSRFSLLVKGGKYTYGLYMYHLIINWVLVRSLGKFLDPSLGRSILIVSGALILSAFVSWASFNFLEKKILALKEKFPSNKRIVPVFTEHTLHGK